MAILFEKIAGTGGRTDGQTNRRMGCNA